MSQPALPGARRPHVDILEASTVGRQAAAVVVTVAVTCGAYPLWLGWHATKHLVAGSSSYAGPYAGWQVAGLAVTLGVVAAAGGWLRLIGATAVTAAGAVTVMFALDAAGKPSEEANLWPIGAVLLLVGATVGLLVVAVLARLVRERVSTGRP